MPDYTARAQAAIDAHQLAGRLEEGNGAETDLWHLLYSLVRWADAKELDFDAVLEQVRQEG